MGVIVIEARKQRAPTEVDNARLRPNLRTYLCVSANAGNAIANEGNSLGNRLGVVHGQDNPVEKNKICSHGAVFLLRYAE